LRTGTPDCDVGSLKLLNVERLDVENISRFGIRCLVIFQSTFGFFDVIICDHFSIKITREIRAKCEESNSLEGFTCKIPGTFLYRVGSCLCFGIFFISLIGSNFSVASAET
jgi:hypothetical protein